MTRACSGLIAIVMFAGAVSGCTTAATLTSVAEAEATDPVLPDMVEVSPASAESGRAVLAAVDEAVAEVSETITAPVMSLAATATHGTAEAFREVAGDVSQARTRLDNLIAAYAAHYEVPETLVRRVVKRESNFRPEARNGPYWGLMQIRHDTARGMGYSGPASGLLDAETNLKYAVRYLRGAYLVAKGNHDQAVRFYARGYYYDAKRAGMLEATGLGRDRRRMR